MADANGSLASTDPESGKMATPWEKAIDIEKAASCSIPPSPTSSTSSQPAPEFQEGGLQGWLAVFGGVLVGISCFGVVQTFGVFQDYYSRVYLTQHSPSEISWIGSTQICLLYVVGLVGGRLFDKGYFHHCLITGSILYVFCIFMLSLAKPHRYDQIFLSQGVGMGIGMGFMMIPSLSLMSHFFRRRRALAMGLIVAGGSLGAVFFPLLLNNVFSRTDGFAWGVRAVGFIALSLLLMANLVMRTRYPKTGGMQQIPVLTIVSDVPYVGYVIGCFLVFWGSFIPFFYLQNFTALHSVSPPILIKYCLTIMNASSFFGRSLPPLLADRFGPINVMIPTAAVTGALIFAMLGATNVAGVVLFAIFYGLFSGSCLSIAAPTVAKFSTRPDHSDIGSRMGVLSFAIGLALLTGNPIAGALLTQEHIWIRPLTFAAVVCIAGSFCFILVWRPLAQRRGTKLV